MQPFDHVVRDHGATVLRVCRAVVGPVDADDAWSETFLAALRAYPELPPDANVRAWLVTIAHRKAIDLIRARNRRALPLGDLPDRGTLDDHETVAPELTSALDALSERQRLAVAYHHLGGLRHAETAEIIGGTEAAVRRAAADGIRALRRALTEPERTCP